MVVENNRSHIDGALCLTSFVPRLKSQGGVEGQKKKASSDPDGRFVRHFVYHNGRRVC